MIIAMAQYKSTRFIMEIVPHQHENIVIKYEMIMAIIRIQKK